MRTLAILSLAGLLFAQEPDLDLERDRRALEPDGSRLALITIIARFEDGTPARGYISCSGWWIKYADEDTPINGYQLPFKTDARGAIGMNPSLSHESMTCWSQKDGKRGSVRVYFSEEQPTGVYEIILR